MTKRVIILGMHKSGTTLVSRILHASGINMGDFQLSMDYNAGHHFERTESLKINNEMLGDQWSKSLNIPIDYEEVSNQIKKKMERLVLELDKRHVAWGIKDPRMAITYTDWQPYLDKHFVIIIFRNPYEILRHYRTAYSLSRWKTLFLWNAYNAMIIRSIEHVGKDRYFILNYKDLMDSDIALEGMENFLQIPLQDERKKKLYRSKPTKSWQVDSYLTEPFHGLKMNQTFKWLLKNRSY